MVFERRFQNPHEKVALFSAQRQLDFGHGVSSFPREHTASRSAGTTRGCGKPALATRNLRMGKRVNFYAALAIIRCSAGEKVTLGDAAMLSISNSPVTRNAADESWSCWH